MKHYKRCPHCYSEFVCWNAFFCGTISSIKGDIYRIKENPNLLKNPRSVLRLFWNSVKYRHISECWDCGKTCSHIFKVRFGIPYSDLKKDYISSTHEIISSHVESVWHHAYQYANSKFHNWDTDKEFHRKWCHKAVDDLFDEDFDFSKIRHHISSRVPEKK